MRQVAAPVRVVATGEHASTSATLTVPTARTLGGDTNWEDEAHARLRCLECGAGNGVRRIAGVALKVGGVAACESGRDHASGTSSTGEAGEVREHGSCGAG